jgi:hypothetical protein
MKKTEHNLNKALYLLLLFLVCPPRKQMQSASAAVMTMKSMVSARNVQNSHGNGSSSVMRFDSFVI